jgi:ribonuclease BN (tRNA processing enzyme)
VILYLPEGPESLKAEFESWDDVFMVVNLSEAKTTVNDFGLFQLAFFSVQHQIPTYGVQLFVSGEKVLTYTADTGWFSSLNASCKDSRYLLAEASLKEYELAERGDTHMTARQAAQLAQHSGVQNLILTHFSPEHNLNQLRREAEAHFEGNLYMSASGKKYTLQP